MTKTRGLSGRARAKARHKSDRAPSRSAGPPAPEQLTRVLDARWAAPLSPAEVMKLDLKRYLADTADVELSPAERLRRLAVHVEPWCEAQEEQPEGWLALARIYDRALAVADDAREEADVLHARAVSAHACAGVEDSRTADKIRQESFRAVHDALALVEDDAELFHLLGVLTVEDRTARFAEALPSFEAALALDPQHVGARFYRALCLQDLERWSEALAAYDVVSPSFFVGPQRAWRLEAFLEGRAHCALKAGELERAEREMTALVERYEKDLRLALDAPLVSLVAAAAGPFYDALGARVRRLCVHLEDRNLVKAFDELRMRRG